MFSNILTGIKDVLLFWRAKRDLRAIFDAFDLDFNKSEASKVLHGMYNPAGTLTVDEDAFEAAYNSQEKKQERAWLYLQFIIAKGDLASDRVLDQLNSFRTFGGMVDLFGMEKVGVMLTVIPDLWWSEYDRSDTGSAGSVC
ncbi:hypothetical protein D9M68_18800 [compost metagenome]